MKTYETKEVTPVDTTPLGSEFREFGMPGTVSFSTSQFELSGQPFIKAGKLEIRPIEGRSVPWAVEVLIDGVKQVGVRRVQINIGVDEVTNLVLEQVLKTERNVL